MRLALIINPWVSDFKLYDEWMHPLGLYYLMSLLLQNGWEVVYKNLLERDSTKRDKRFGTADFNSVECDKPSLYNSIPRKYKLYGKLPALAEKELSVLPKPDIIFVGTSMTYWLIGLVKTIELLKLIFPSVPIVVGGTAARLIPEILKQKLPADIHISSASLFDSCPFESIPIKFLSELNLTSWRPNLIDSFSSMSKIFHAPVHTSIGCPLKCSYCASSILAQTYSTRPIRTVVDEIEFMIRRFGVADFAFYDDALLWNPQEHFIPFIKAVLARGFNVRFHIPNGIHLSRLNEQILELMKKAGFVTLRFGYESSLKKHQLFTKAKSNRSETVSKIALVRKTGFELSNCGVYVMGGLPNQSPEEMIEEIDFIGSLGIKAKPVFLSPVPKSPLFNLYAKTFPSIKTDPLWHNDTFFITQLPGWNWHQVQFIMDRTRQYNQKIAASSNLFE